MCCPREKPFDMCTPYVSTHACITCRWLGVSGVEGGPPAMRCPLLLPPIQLFTHRRRLKTPRLQRVTAFSVVVEFDTSRGRRHRERAPPVCTLLCMYYVCMEGREVTAAKQRRDKIVLCRYSVRLLDFGGRYSTAVPNICCLPHFINNCRVPTPTHGHWHIHRIHTEYTVPTLHGQLQSYLLRTNATKRRRVLGLGDTHSASRDTF